MWPKKSSDNYLKDQLDPLIDALDLTPLQKQFLQSRWLDQVLWMEGRAGRDQKRYYLFRLMAIVGGVIVPVLTTLNISGGAGSGFRWSAFGVSLLVAISIAVEEFFHYGERWRHYRRTVEWLKGEGWQFFQRSGPYQGFDNHSDAYLEFATRVEEIIQTDVEKFITKVVAENKEKRKDNP